MRSETIYKCDYCDSFYSTSKAVTKDHEKEHYRATTVYYNQPKFDVAKLVATVMAGYETTPGQVCIEYNGREIWYHRSTN